MVHDLIVIGGGPAGLTAGIYARTRNLSTLILEAEQAGGQLVWLYPPKSVYDYPRYIAVEGGEPPGAFVGHAPGGGGRGGVSGVRTGKGADGGRAVIIAIGNGPFNPRVLEVPGEDEHEGRGVHYRGRDRRGGRGQTGPRG